MNVAPKFPIEPVPDHWCWIGEDDSVFLDGLIDWLESRRSRPDQTSDYNVQLVNVSSSKKLHKILAKANADVFVWSIDRAGIAGLVQEIAWLQRVQPSVLQLVAGLASPAERTHLFEAGARFHIEHADQWQSQK